MKSFHRSRGLCLVLAVGTIAGLLGVGCPRPEEDRALELDLVVADAGLAPDLKNDVDSPFNYARILVYQDVLREDSQQEPDLVLSGETIPELQHPVSIVVDFGALYVCDDVYGAVLCWQNLLRYVHGHEDNLSPDIVFDGNGAVGEPVDVVSDFRALYVADLSPQNTKECCGAVHIFVDAFYLHADQAPDYTLTDPSIPVNLALGDDRLYVADAGLSRVLVYDVSGIPYTDKAITPDFVELSGPSWRGLDSQAPITPTGVAVFDNRLYVTTLSNILFTFSPADSLQDYQEPDAVIAETSGALDAPMAMAQVGDRLFVGNQNIPPLIVGRTIGDAKANTVGMVGFDVSQGLVDGQQPSIVFDTSNAQIPAVRELFSTYDVLVSATSAPVDTIVRLPLVDPRYPVGDVHILRHADKLHSGRPGDLVLPALKDFVGPLSIDGTYFIEGASAN